jgi:hypothetical protein
MIRSSENEKRAGNELKVAKGPKELSIITGKMIVLVFTCAEAFRNKEQRQGIYVITKCCRL